MDTMRKGFQYKGKMRIVGIAGILFLFILLNAGCGGGGGGDGHSTAVKEGTFFGGLVEGLDYTATGSNDKVKRGTTDENGVFEYYEDDAVDSTIQFAIGDFKLGSPVSAKLNMSPADIQYNVGIDSNEAINMTRFLMALDYDGNPANGILIPDKINLKSSTTITFFDYPDEFEQNLKSILVEVNDEDVYDYWDDDNKKGYEPELPSVELAYKYLKEKMFPKGIYLDHLSTDISFPSLVNVFITAQDVNGTAYVFNSQQDIIDQFFLKESLGTETSDIVSGDPEYMPVIDQRDSFPYVLKCVLMIDRSTSVSEYLDAIKTAAKDILLIPSGDDTVDYQQEWAIYQFSDPDEITEVIGFTAAGQDELTDAIEGLSANTYPSTDLYGGIQYGLSQWTTSYKKDQIEQGLVVVITDGRDTSGTIADPQTLIDAVGDEKVFVVIVGDDSMENLRPTYKITGDSIELLKYQTETEEIPKETLDLLRLIKNDEYDTEDEFKDAVQQAIGNSLTDRFYDRILELSTFRGEELKDIAVNGGFFEPSQSLTSSFQTISSDIKNLMDSLYRIQYYSPTRSQDDLVNTTFEFGCRGDATNEYNYSSEETFKSVSEVDVTFSSEKFTYASKEQIYINASYEIPDGIGFLLLNDAMIYPALMPRCYSSVDLIASTFYQPFISQYTWNLVDSDGVPYTSTDGFMDVDYFTSKATIDLLMLQKGAGVIFEVTDTVATETNTTGDYTSYVAMISKTPNTLEDDEYMVDFDTNLFYWDFAGYTLKDADGNGYYDDNTAYHEDPGESSGSLFDETPENYLISPKILFVAGYKVSFSYRGNRATLKMSTDKKEWVTLWSIASTGSTGNATILYDTIAQKFYADDVDLFEDDALWNEVYFKFSSSDETTAANNDLTISDFRVGPDFYAVTVTVEAEGVIGVGGEVSMSPVSDEPSLRRYMKGAQITLTATPAEGYTFKEWRRTFGSALTVNQENNLEATITSIDEATVIRAIFEAETSE